MLSSSTKRYEYYKEFIRNSTSYKNFTEKYYKEPDKNIIFEISQLLSSYDNKINSSKGKSIGKTYLEGEYNKIIDNYLNKLKSEYIIFGDTFKSKIIFYEDARYGYNFDEVKYHRRTTDILRKELKQNSYNGASILNEFTEFIDNLDPYRNITLSLYTSCIRLYNDMLIEIITINQLGKKFQSDGGFVCGSSKLSDLYGKLLRFKIDFISHYNEIETYNDQETIYNESDDEPDDEDNYYEDSDDEPPTEDGEDDDFEESSDEE